MMAETSTEGSLGVQTTSGCTSTSVISSNTGGKHWDITGVSSQKKKKKQQQEGLTNIKATILLFIIILKYNYRMCVYI